MQNGEHGGAETVQLIRSGPGDSSRASGEAAHDVEQPSSSSNSKSAVAAGIVLPVHDTTDTMIGLALYTSSTVTNSGMSVLPSCWTEAGKAGRSYVPGGYGFPVFEIVMVRSIFILGCAAVPVILYRVPPLGTKRGFLVLRGVCSFLSVSALYWSVNLLPLSDALVLQFLSPPMVAASAPFLINETPPRVVYIAIPVCLLAVILISRPSAIFGETGTSEKTVSALGVALGIFQAVAASANKLVTRYLKGENTNVNLLYLGSVSTVGALFMSLVLPHAFIAPSSGSVWGLLFANALCGYLTQLFITSGLKRVAATLGTATSYLTVVWGMGLGYFVFHEVPTYLSIAGAALICASALMMSILESRPPTAVQGEGRPVLQEQRGSGGEGLRGVLRWFAFWRRPREQEWTALRTSEGPEQETELTLIDNRH